MLATCWIGIWDGLHTLDLFLEIFNASRMGKTKVCPPSVDCIKSTREKQRTAEIGGDNSGNRSFTNGGLFGNSRGRHDK